MCLCIANDVGTESVRAVHLYLPMHYIVVAIQLTWRYTFIWAELVYGCRDISLSATHIFSRKQWRVIDIKQFLWMPKHLLCAFFFGWHIPQTFKHMWCVWYYYMVNTNSRLMRCLVPSCLPYRVQYVSLFYLYSPIHI